VPSGSLEAAIVTVILLVTLDISLTLQPYTPLLILTVGFVLIGSLKVISMVFGPVSSTPLI
jgi:hypothetical protein